MALTSARINKALLLLARKSRRDKINNVEIKQIMDVEKDIVEVINEMITMVLAYTKDE